MTSVKYFAIIYVLKDGKEDGEFECSMPCFTEEEVLRRASQYEHRARVIREGLPPFWLSVNDCVKEQYSNASIKGQARPLELSGMSDGDYKETVGLPRTKEFHTIEPSQVFYDPWAARKGSKSLSDY